MIPAILTPILTRLAENGLNLLVDAVSAKGKDFVEEKLGVSLESSIRSEEGLLKLKQLELSHEEFLVNVAKEQAESELKQLELDNQNTASARSMNIEIQSSDHASYLSKNVAYWIDMFVVFATFTMAYTIVFKTVPTENKEIFYTAFGALLTICLTVVNFHRGTSARSQTKDNTIQKLLKGS